MMSTLGSSIFRVAMANRTPTIQHLDTDSLYCYMFIMIIMMNDDN